MDDEPELRHYERGPTRVRAGSGVRWAVAGGLIALAVVATGVAGTMVAPALPSAPPIAQDTVPSAPAPSGPADAETAAGDGLTDAETAGLPPIDVTSGASGYTAAFDARRRRSLPLVVESTDFHANSGPAYYGIGGRLIRALEATPTPSAPTP